MCRNREQDVYNTLGALLVSTLFMGILNSIFVLPVVGNERTVVYRERAAGMYGVAPWYLAMVRCSAPQGNSVCSEKI